MKQSDFDSREEMYIWWWLKEAEEAGLISDLKFTGSKGETPISILGKHDFLVADTESRVNFVQIKKRQLVGRLTYKADFEFRCTEKGRMILIGEYGISTGEPLMSSFGDKNLVYLEVKPYVFQGRNKTGSHDSMRRFKVIQKVIYSILGIYVNLFEVPKIFEQTFTPRRFMFCDKKVSQPRRLKYEPRSLSDFVAKRKEKLALIASKGIRNETPDERAVLSALEGKGS
jgi:hypothetical protein